MSHWDRARDREFQLEVLQVQLKHERKTVRYGAQMAVGVSFFAFSLTFYATIMLSLEEPSSFVHALVTFFSTIGFLMTWISIRRLKSLRIAEAKDIEKLRKKYLVW